MEVQLVLREWKVEQDARTKSPKIVGSYAIMNGDKEVGVQRFNDYTGKEIAFSQETVKAVENLESLLRAEFTRIFS